MRRQAGMCAVIGALVLLGGCRGMRPSHRELVTAWESKATALGYPEVRYRQVKSPRAAAALGLLPGVGGFYTGRSGIGVAGLLTWPINLLWEPALAYSAAYEYNFARFRDRVIDLALMQATAAERELERQLEHEEISLPLFQRRRDRVLRCRQELSAQKGLRSALRAPAAIAPCLEDVSALAGSPAQR